MDPWLGLVVLLAGFVQGVTGFGFALVALPLLSLGVPMAQAVPLVVILSLGTNLVILAQTYRNIAFSKIWVLVASSFVAAPSGTNGWLSSRWGSSAAF